MATRVLADISSGLLVLLIDTRSNTELLTVFSI